MREYSLGVSNKEINKQAMEANAEKIAAEIQKMYQELDIARDRNMIEGIKGIGHIATLGLLKAK